MQTTRSGKTQTIVAVLMMLLVLCTHSLHAQSNDPADEILKRIGVDEKLGAMVPLDLQLTDQEGAIVKLGDFFSGEPVILTLNYYECPMLCPLIFRNLVNTMAGIRGLSLNKDFRIVTVSFNPDETPARTKEKALDTYAMLRGIAVPEQRWPFLYGSKPDIGRLTAAVGYRFVQLAKDNFAHPAAIIVLTPDGRISRYLYGMEQPPRDLKLALIEAAGGRTGGSTLLNQALMYCFHYDPVGRRYALAALRIVNLVAGTTLLLLAVLLVTLWRREKKHR